MEVDLDEIDEMKLAIIAKTLGVEAIDLRFVQKEPKRYAGCFSMEYTTPDNMRKRLALIPEGETMGNGILFFIDLQALRDGLDTCPTIFYPDGNMDFSNTGNLFVPNPLFGKCEEEIRLLWGIMGEGK